MGTNFAMNDKIEVIGGLKAYIGKTGVIVKDGGVPNIAAGFRKLGEGVKSKKGTRHLWVILLDNTHETIVLPEDNLKKIS